MKRIIFLLLLICLGLYFAELKWVHPDPHHESWHNLKGIYLFLGVFGSIAMMVFAKSLGKFFLYRDEDYYDD